MLIIANCSGLSGEPASFCIVLCGIIAWIMLDAKAAAATLMTFEIFQSPFATFNLWDIKLDC